MKNQTTSAESNSDPGLLVDLAQYPIDAPQSYGYQSLIRVCHRRLKADGVCILPGFLLTQATSRMAEETDRIVDRAFQCRDDHNPYLDTDDPAWPIDHPRRNVQATNLDVLGYDLIAQEDALHNLYNWEPLVDFTRDVLSKPVLYRMADPLAAVTVNVMREGQYQGWHFDEAEITTTIMLQEPEAGGAFEYVPHLRSQEDANYGDVKKVLDGTHSGIRALAVKAGTMVIFAGHFAMHRVTHVEGNRTRYVAILCFKDTPGVMNSPEVQMLFYGKTSK
ncbi:MAG: 2OG-Fe(II) oxygenase [Candidatus Latescibacteria bacterium]|nr:2OG-Fe(II) oxygenase [Candidatus Latescibacterota bacterium]